MSLVDAALRYAARRIPVIPMCPESKRPLIKDWQVRAGLSDAGIRSWWERWPAANVGLLCSWFWALDCDPKNGGDRTLVEWIRDHGPLPTTWEQATPSGGTHWLFRRDPRLESVPLGSLSLGGKSLGVDLKGAGRHYILAAPSRTAIGTYQWARGPRDCELASAPEWLIQLILRLKTVVPEAPIDYSRFAGCDRVERARQYLERVPPAIQGSGGDPHTWRTVLKAVRGFALSIDEGMAAMRDWNSTCQPPWNECDLRRIIGRALQRGSSIAIGAKLEGRRAA